MIDRRLFFNSVRGSLFGGSLKQSQVDGMNYLLDVFEAGYKWLDRRWLAYAFATTYHETAFTMQPIPESGGQSYLQSKPYYPYYGRGFVQLTWEENYRKMGSKIGFDLLGGNKERALEPAIAAEILYTGMRDGDFTGKKLSMYFNENTDDPVNARRIINGTDDATEIAGHHAKFLAAFREADVADNAPPPPAPSGDYVTRAEFNAMLDNVIAALGTSKLKT